MLSSSILSIAYVSWLSAAAQIPLNDQHASPFTPSYDKFVASQLKKWYTPGFAVAVIDGEETFSKGYGIATFPDTPVTPSTLFYTASTTKSFVSAALSLLIDDSLNSSNPISWRTPLAEVMREDFVLPDDYATLHTTFEDALSHRTGMPAHDLSWNEVNTTVRDVVRKLRHLPMTAEIRSQWQYCNIMYVTISHFIETWTGKWLGDFLRNRIYQPLGMTSTFFSLKDAQDAEASGGDSLATGYLWDNLTKTYEAFPWVDAPQVSGAGATISNVLDYAKWLRCHMTSSSPLSSAGHHALHSPRMISGLLSVEIAGFRGMDAYALGWDISNYRGENIIWHTGGLPGFTTMMLYFPRLQWGLTGMMNGGDGSALLALTFGLLDDKLGIPDDQRFDWDIIANVRHSVALETLMHAKDLLYPNAPRGKAVIPLSLPVGMYAGTYNHPAYPSFIVTPNASTLSHTHPILYGTPQSEQIFSLAVSLEHVSGENFVVYARSFTNKPRRSPDDYDTSTDQVSKAEFQIGEDGQVAALGLALTPEMGGAKIWFRKAREDRDGAYEGRSGADGKSARAAPFYAGEEVYGPMHDASERFRPLFKVGMSAAPPF